MLPLVCVPLIHWQLPWHLAVKPQESIKVPCTFTVSGTPWFFLPLVPQRKNPLLLSSWHSAFHLQADLAGLVTSSGVQHTSTNYKEGQAVWVLQGEKWGAVAALDPLSLLLSARGQALGKQFLAVVWGCMPWYHVFLSLRCAVLILTSAEDN